MKTILLKEIGRLEIEDVPMPQIKGAKDVLLKVAAVGICGSDIHYYRRGKIGDQIIQFPFVIGHECAAIVESVGEAVSKIKSKDKVVIDPAISCGDCDQCRIGRRNLCRNLKFLGCPGQKEGCFSEYIVMPEDCCFPHSKLSTGQAVLCEPLSVALYAVRLADLNAGDSIAILGAGPIGLSCLVTAVESKVTNCFVTEPIEARRQAAADNGAVWVGNPDKQDIVSLILQKQPDGLDVVFECAGKQETIDQAIELLKPAGKLVLVGIPPQDLVSFDIHKMRRKALQIINVRRQNDCTADCIEMLETGRINVDFMLTHRFKPQDANKAFKLVGDYRDGVIKAVVEF